MNPGSQVNAAPFFIFDDSSVNNLIQGIQSQKFYEKF